MAYSLSMRLSWYLALLAVVAEFTISGNLLTFLGSPYISDGGLFVAKIHPGSYLATLSGICTAIGRASQRGRHGVNVPVAGFLGGIALCAAYEIVTTGSGNVVVLIDTFFPAGMLALALCDLHETRKLTLRHLAQCLLVVNAGIALCELMFQTHLVPLPVAEYAGEAEFRPTALYDHALTGAAVTMLGLWLMPLEHGLGKWCYLLLLFAALVAFGERAPLATVMLGGLVYFTNRYAIRILARDLHAKKIAVVGSAIAVAVGVSLAIVTLADNAEIRLGSHLYWDDSAQVRFNQFSILDTLAPRELLFGCPRADLLALIEPLRLSLHVGVIENFWLFTFVVLGLFGFLIFLLTFLSLIGWLWRKSGTDGHYMIVLFLVVASASNSLGRKSTLLVTLVACVVSSTTHMVRSRAPTITRAVLA